MAWQQVFERLDKSLDFVTVGICATETTIRPYNKISV